MVVYDLNDGIWVYNEILLSKIFERNNEEDQRKILIGWINETTRKYCKSRLKAYNEIFGDELCGLN
jgi:hypothetical protein